MKSHVGGSHSQTNFMTYGILGGTSADFKIEVDSDYHFRVRVVTNDGYRGAWSQEYHTLSSGTVLIACYTVFIQRVDLFQRGTETWFKYL